MNKQRVTQPESKLGDFSFDLERRRKLLPWWIKTCCWIFMIMGAFVVVGGLVSAIYGFDYQISLYGLETHEPISLIGIILTIVYLLKAIVSFGLWTEQDWAIMMGKIDAMLGIALCIASWFIIPMLTKSEIGVHFSFRLEIVFLGLFFYKLKDISNHWSGAVKGKEKA